MSNQLQQERDDAANPRASRDGRQRTLLLVFAALAIVSLLILGYRYWFGGDGEKGEVAATNAGQAVDEKENVANEVTLSADAIKHAGIEIGEVVTTELRETFEATGRLTLNEDNTARVGTIVTGRVSRVLATVGDRVRKGQPLVYIHSHELLSARADADKARAQVIEKEKALAYARAELERAERLLEARALSVREKSLAAANVVAATAELEAARAELTRAAEWLEHLTVPHDSHDDIVVYSPISGMVLKRDVTLGTVVNETNDLFVIANLSNLWAMAEVPEQQAIMVGIGQPVEIKVPAFENRTFTGRIVHIGNVLNPETRTIQVRCLVDNAGGVLRPEMYATIRISRGGARSALVIPVSALQDVQGQKMVFLARGNGVFEKRVVRTGSEQNQKVEILEGLSAGDRIVMRGGFFIKSEFLKGTMSEE